MKLQEAIEKRVPGCTIKISSNEHIVEVDECNDYFFTFMPEKYDFERDDWEIEYPRPRVLTVEEAIKNYNSHFEQPMLRIEMIAFRGGFEMGFESGYLKHKLKCKPLEDAIIRYTSQTTKINMDELFEEFEKLENSEE